MRTTLGTRLARHGAKPQVAREIMRHSDYKTTLKHYTVLGLNDTAKAIEQLPRIAPPATGRAKTTGADGAQRMAQRTGRESVQAGATVRTNTADETSRTSEDNPGPIRKMCGITRHDAATCDKAGEGTRTLNIQLGRLPAPYGSAA